MAAADMLDLRNLTPFQKRLAMLCEGAGFQLEFEGLSCPIYDRNSASFLACRFSSFTARLLSERKFLFTAFADDEYRLRVWLS